MERYAYEKRRLKTDSTYLEILLRSPFKSGAVMDDRPGETQVSRSN